MNQLPIVSIVVPSLNRAQFIVPTLESILNQGYPNLECIVIDGGSIDGTLEILKRYEGRIKWVSGTDKNLADAVNKGWQMATGEIVTWLNCDDFYAHANVISRIAHYFQDHSTADVVYGDYKLLSEDGQAISSVMKPRLWDLDYAVKHCHYIIPQPASFIRRSALEGAGYLDTEIGNNIDHELWLRISLIGKLEYLPAFLAYTRICAGLLQNPNAARAKVRTNESFLSRTDLPERLQSNSFRRRAMSNAYLAGAITALTGRHLKFFASYLIKAVQEDPLNFVIIFAKTARALVSSLFSTKFKIRVRGYLGTIKGEKQPYNLAWYATAINAPRSLKQEFIPVFFRRDYKSEF
jgi:glycosyltransferase involved in cell wall biosynthesis